MGAQGHTPATGVEPASHWPDLPKEEIFAELDKILESHHFRASKKCSRFLRHLVESAVDGRFDSLKERTIGIDVFDREPHYDTNQDPIVRGTAGEVRKRLAQFYLEAGDSEIRFGLAPGSYVPEVHYHPSERPNHIHPEQRLFPKPSERIYRPRIAGIAVAVCALLASCLWLMFRTTPLDRFWAPILRGKAVLVCMGQPQFYTFHHDTATVLNSWFENEPNNPHGKPPFATVQLDQIVPMWGNSVALADAQAFSRLANRFALKRKPVDLRGERLISLSDLRHHPSVFIGAFDNDWTLTLASDLRFHFEMDERSHVQSIRDRARPAARDWELVDAWPPGKDINQDYALVTRVVNHTTEQTIVILGGIAQYGTEAAAEFVTDPAYFERALAHAPRDWHQKNMQFVLSTRVLSGVSGPPTVVAAYFW